MEFTITCPNDGPVEVSIEDVDTVVLQEPERAEIVFTCPRCGEPIRVQIVIPSFLMAAIEAMAEDGDGHPPIAGLVALVSDEAIVVEEPAREDDPVIDSYCEYFRRQLDHVGCVDDALSEIDSTT
jgi:hypothetical protein